jgi:hypothetical protein
MLDFDIHPVLEDRPACNAPFFAVNWFCDRLNVYREREGNPSIWVMKAVINSTPCLAVHTLSTPQLIGLFTTSSMEHT